MSRVQWKKLFNIFTTIYTWGTCLKDNVPYADIYNFEFYVWIKSLEVPCASCLLWIRWLFHSSNWTTCQCLCHFGISLFLFLSILDELLTSDQVLCWVDEWYRCTTCHTVYSMDFVTSLYFESIQLNFFWWMAEYSLGLVTFHRNRSR